MSGKRPAVAAQLPQLLRVESESQATNAQGTEMNPLVCFDHS